MSYRSRSEAEVRTKLHQLGYPDPVIAQTLGKLRELNYLDDQTFAQDWAQFRIRDRRYGPKRIEDELRSKGIPPELRREVIRVAFGPGIEKETAKKLLERKFSGENLREPETLRRAIAYLERRGFGESVITELLRRSGEEE